MCVKLLQLCQILWDPTDYSPPGSSVHGDSPGKNTGVGCQALLRGMAVLVDGSSSQMLCSVLFCFKECHCANNISQSSSKTGKSDKKCPKLQELIKQKEGVIVMRPVLCYCETHRHLDEGVSQADGWALT